MERFMENSWWKEGKKSLAALTKQQSCHAWAAGLRVILQRRRGPPLMCVKALACHVDNFVAPECPLGAAGGRW